MSKHPAYKSLLLFALSFIYSSALFAQEPDVQNSPSKAYSPEIYVVQPGNTLYSIARYYGVTVEDIRKWNNLSSNQISVGQKLIVGYTGDAQESAQPSENENQESTEIQQPRYRTVQPGNTLYSISKEYGVSVDEIKRWNNLPSNQISVGQKLIVGYKTVTPNTAQPQTEDAQPGDKKTEQPQIDAQNENEITEQDAPRAKEHVVQKGNTLYSIAKENGVSMADILMWNNLPSNQISVGQKLIVGYTSEPEEAQPQKELKEKSEKTKETAAQQIQSPDSITPQPTIYVVKPGNSIFYVAGKFKTPVSDIKKWNNLSSNEITAGQELIVGYTLNGKKVAAPVVQSESVVGENKIADETLEPVIAQPDIPDENRIEEAEIQTTATDTVVPVSEETNSFAENALAAYKKNKVVKVSGKISAQLGAYDSWGTTSRRDNFTYLFTGNVTVNIAGVSIPFSAVVSQQEASFMQPFNQFGASPNYKWITVHAGYRSLQYSSFTVNNHLFLGAGVDINPEIKEGSGWKLRLSAMGGRFRRTVEVDTTNPYAMPAYKRTGGGFKIGVEKNGSFVDLILFKAKDKDNSLTFPENVYTVLPEENLVLGITGQHYLFKKKILLKAELAGSAYTRDTRSVESTDGAGKFYSALGFTGRESSHYDYALKTEASYRGKNYSVGLTYGRITGDYLSMGSYFFQNDVEDLAGNFSYSFLKGKASLSASLGAQWTNISNEKLTSNRRIIASLNYNHQLNDKLNFNFNLSNYSSFLQFTRDVETDSLNLYQVSQNYTVGLNYNIGKKGRGEHGLWTTVAYQEAHARQEYEIEKDATRFYNASLGHTVSFSKPGISLSSSFNFSVNKSSLFKSSNFGPAFSLTKQLLKKKMRLNYNLSLLASRDDSDSNGRFIRNTISCSYKLSKHHAFNLGIYHFSKSGSGNTSPFSELRGDVRYEFTF